MIVKLKEAVFGVHLALASRPREQPLPASWSPFYRRGKLLTGTRELASVHC